MNIKQQVKYYTAHTPRCISEFEVTAVDLAHVEFDGHGEELNITFKLQCTCGSQCGKILMQYYHDDGILSDPISFQCDSCGKISPVFDSRYQGYDGELGHHSDEPEQKEAFKPYHCQTCHKSVMEIMVRFEYPDDLFDDDFDDFHGKEQDLFSWFTLLGTCQQCHTFQYIEDVECA